MTIKTLHDRALLQWQKLSPKWRYELGSAFNTFVPASLLEASVQYHINGNAFPTEKGVLLAIVLACIRAGWKALIAFAVAQIRLMLPE